MHIQSLNEDQSVVLKNSISVVNIQFKLMKTSLEKNRLMDGIKHCSNLLAELRTSTLNPKNYYELYMYVFDVLRHFAIYLNEYHHNGKHHLADLYELVQYASSIIPRLYLMSTVGCIYLAEPESPIDEILSDMMEMTRGVQHPIRGLFLRHYLGGMARDYLPNNGQHLDATIKFILNNFAEMNKLWVRVQHLGHSRDRAKREVERKELGTLVGTNLVRLSQLEGVDLEVYQTVILPGILSQVINCHDVMAQEYLMDVIIQIFPDEFHIQTLKPFLATTAQLHDKVDIKAISISLLERLTAFANAETEKLVEISNHGNAEDAVTVNQELFILFWNEIMELIKTRRGLPVQDQTSLFLSLANFSLSCYPDEISYIDHIFAFTKDSIFANYAQSAELHSKQSEANVLNLLLAPTKQWDVLVLITSLKHFQPLLAMQPYSTRRTVAFAILDNILSRETKLGKPEQVYQILEICHVLVRDSNSREMSTTSLLMGSGYSEEDDRDEEGWVARLIHLFYSDNEDIQFLLLDAAKQQLEKGEPKRVKKVFPSLIISSLKLALRYFNKRPSFVVVNKEVSQEDGSILSKADDAGVEEILEKKDADEQREYDDEEKGNVDDTKENSTSDHEPSASPTVTTATNSISDHDSPQEIWNKKMTTLYRFIHQIIMILSRQCDGSESQCVQFFLMASQNADYCENFTQVAYDFFLDAFRIYEESVSHSRAQFSALVYSIGSLLSTSPRLRQHHLGYYTTLSTKITLYSAKLLKKPDQARAVYLSSHLWLNELPARVIECLQKSLKIADSCMDAVTNELLFLELLNQYLYYYEQDEEGNLVTPNSINNLIDLIHSNMAYIKYQEGYPITSDSSCLIDHNHDQEVVDYIHRQYQDALDHIKLCQERSDKHLLIHKEK